MFNLGKFSGDLFNTCNVVELDEYCIGNSLFQIKVWCSKFECVNGTILSLSFKYPYSIISSH